MQALELRLEAASVGASQSGRAATAVPVSGPTDERRSVPGHRGRPERRTHARPPDRRGRRGRDHGRRRPSRRRARGRRAAVGERRRRPGRPGRPGRRLLGGPHRRGRAARGGRAGHRGRGLPARPVCPAQRRRRRRSRRGSSTRTRTCCSRGRAKARCCFASAAPGYLEILAAGGGILSTVAATRAASVDELLAHGRRWLDEMLGHGVTTVEAKSGYGLDLETEVRLVEVAHRLGRGRPDRGHPDLPRRPRRPARVPVAARRDGGLRPVDHRGPAPGHRRPRASALLRRVLRGRRVRRRPVAPDPRGGREPGNGARGCTPTSSRRPAAPSWPPRSGRSRPTTWRRRPRPGSRRSPRPRRTAARSSRPSCRSRPGS